MNAHGGLLPTKPGSRQDHSLSDYWIFGEPPWGSPQSTEPGEFPPVVMFPLLVDRRSTRQSKRSPQLERGTGFFYSCHTILLLPKALEERLVKQGVGESFQPQSGQLVRKYYQLCGSGCRKPYTQHYVIRSLQLWQVHRRVRLWS